MDGLHGRSRALQVRIYAHLDVFALMTNTSFEASISLGMGARETLGSDIQGGVKAKTEEENSWLLSKVKENEKVPPCVVAVRHQTVPRLRRVLLCARPAVERRPGMGAPPFRVGRAASS
jgi:hypothetical protein